MLEEIQRSTTRPFALLDRQRCVKVGLSEVRKLPSVNDIDERMLTPGPRAPATGGRGGSPAQPASARKSC